MLRPNKYAVLGCASDRGGLKPGSATGPRVLRERGLIDALRRLGLNVTDFGDVDGRPPEGRPEDFTPEELKQKNTLEVYSACKHLADRLKPILQDGHFPIVLGGDHSLSLGSTSAIANHYAASGSRVGLIWVDAHPDINTPGTSHSGHYHGMPNSYACGLYQGGFTALQTARPAILPHNIAYIALRDVDPDERSILKSSGISAYTMKDIDTVGAAAAVQKSIEAASEVTAGFILSFDIDACDPMLVPGTGTPYRGGLTFRESHLIMELIHDSAKMLALELVEVNPGLDLNYQTADLAVSLVESAFGKAIL